jgi:hypothetical protein
MNSQGEIQLSDDLRHIVAGQPFAPDVEAIERRGRRRRQRSIAIRGLAGLTVLGLVLAGGVAADHVSSTGGAASQATTRTATKATGKAKTETVAYVQKQISAAALTLNNYLIKSRQNTSGSGPTEITIWTDPRTGNTMLLQGSGSGRLAYWEHDYFDSHRVLHWEQTQVNYGPRTWWTYNEHAAGPIQGPVPPGPVGGNYNTPAQIKQWLDQGVGKILDYPVVDGHHTVELAVFTGPAKTYVVFADTRTYQVVRTIDYFPTAQATPITANYSWIPRSPAMVNLINHPQIPAGFTQVPAGY